MDARLRTSIQNGIKRLQANKRTKGKEREAKEVEERRKKKIKLVVHTTEYCITFKMD